MQLWSTFNSQQHPNQPDDVFLMEGRLVYVSTRHAKEASAGEFFSPGHYERSSRRGSLEALASKQLLITFVSGWHVWGSLAFVNSEIERDWRRCARPVSVKLSARAGCCCAHSACL